jgi:hypothetical protein
MNLRWRRATTIAVRTRVSRVRVVRVGAAVNAGIIRDWGMSTIVAAVKRGVASFPEWFLIRGRCLWLRRSFSLKRSLSLRRGSGAVTFTFTVTVYVTVYIHNIRVLQLIGSQTKALWNVVLAGKAKARQQPLASFAV